MLSCVVLFGAPGAPEQTKGGQTTEARGRPFTCAMPTRDRLLKMCHRSAPLFVEGLGHRQRQRGLRGPAPYVCVCVWLHSPISMQAHGVMCVCICVPPRLNRLVRVVVPAFDYAHSSIPIKSSCIELQTGPATTAAPTSQRTYVAGGPSFVDRASHLHQQQQARCGPPRVHSTSRISSRSRRSRAGMSRRSRTKRCVCFSLRSYRSIEWSFLLDWARDWPYVDAGDTGLNGLDLRLCEWV